MRKPKEITDHTFIMEVLRSGTPCVVDFWAEWSIPCKSLKHVLGDLQKTYGDRVMFKKLNVEVNPITPRRLGIRSVPAILFSTGEKMSRLIVGIHPKAVIESAVRELITD